MDVMERHRDAFEPIYKDKTRRSLDKSILQCYSNSFVSELYSSNSKHGIDTQFITTNS